jgi:hypothetical protein
LARIVAKSGKTIAAIPGCIERKIDEDTSFSGTADCGGAVGNHHVQPYGERVARPLKNHAKEVADEMCVAIWVEAQCHRCRLGDEPKLGPTLHAALVGDGDGFLGAAAAHDAL